MFFSTIGSAISVQHGPAKLAFVMSWVSLACNRWLRHKIVMADPFVHLSNSLRVATGRGTASDFFFISAVVALTHVTSFMHSLLSRTEHGGA